MLEQDNALGETLQGNTSSAEDIIPAEVSPATNAEQSRSSGCSVVPTPQATSNDPGQTGTDIHAMCAAVPSPRSDRIEAPRLEPLLKEVKQFLVGDIHADPDIQVRARVNEKAIVDYAERMREGDTFPAVVVFHDGTRHWLADGFHRLAAIQQTGFETITAEIRHGGRQEALKYALGANLSHGLRRTNDDKHRAVEIALREFSDQSDRVIAGMCGVGNQLVGVVRRQVCEPHASSIRIGFDGKKYTQKKPRQKADSDQVPTNLPPFAETVSEPDASDIAGSVADQEPPPAFEFSLADGSSFVASAWTKGWIDAKAAATKVRSLEAAAKSLVSVDKEACAMDQRILLGFFSMLNRELGHEPSHDALHRLHDVLDIMVCLLRNTVMNHRNYHPDGEQLYPWENDFCADDDHND